mmetsp:Transcript_4789/g.7172  ORF Transcript_4789/g.7172 Transcript_4789/m.7172 type:complete len:258 (+) Transcript_4789:784-1557(+)
MTSHCCPKIWIKCARTPKRTTLVWTCFLILVTLLWAPNCIIPFIRSISPIRTCSTTSLGSDHSHHFITPPETMMVNLAGTSRRQTPNTSHRQRLFAIARNIMQCPILMVFILEMMIPSLHMIQTMVLAMLVTTTSRISMLSHGVTPCLWRSRLSGTLGISLPKRTMVGNGVWVGSSMSGSMTLWPALTRHLNLFSATTLLVGFGMVTRIRSITGMVVRNGLSTSNGVAMVKKKLTFSTRSARGGSMVPSTTFSGTMV